MGKKIKTYMIVICLVAIIPLTVYSGDYQYVASKFSVKYHLPTCKQALRIHERNRIMFNTAQEAVRAGYLPCGVCKPPTRDKGQDVLSR